MAEYDPLDEDEDNGHVMFVQVFNFGQKVQTNLCRGYLPSQIILFLQNIHNSPRRIWLVRTGEKNSAEGTLGGDDPLTRRGHKFSEALWHYIKAQAPAVSAGGEEILVWTGTAIRAMETRQYMEEDDMPCISSPALNDIRRGEFEGKSTEEWEKDCKEELKARGKDYLQDQLRYQWPGGESYLDVIERLRPIILELERTQCSVVVIAPRAILRVLYAYFAGTEDLQALPSLNPGQIMSNSGPSQVTELRHHSELGYTINHIRIFNHDACQSIDCHELEPPNAHNAVRQGGGQGWAGAAGFLLR